MIYAVIDTNVFVSALLSHHSDAATVQVVEAISYGVQYFSLIPKVIAMPQTVARKLDKKVRIQDFVSFFIVSLSLSCEASVA